ncbi:hypothetical protein [Burkholderia stagnalis]|nr:hypothetical protein [Burkholderia stagnalis]
MSLTDGDCIGAGDEQRAGASNAPAQMLAQVDAITLNPDRLSDEGRAIR